MLWFIKRVTGTPLGNGKKIDLMNISVKAVKTKQKKNVWAANSPLSRNTILAEYIYILNKKNVLNKRVLGGSFVSLTINFNYNQLISNVLYWLTSNYTIRVFHEISNNANIGIRGFTV